MSLDTLAEKLKAQAALNPPLGYRVVFNLGEGGVIMWDGTVTPAEIAPAEAVDDAADTVLTLSPESFDQLLAGTLDPTLAYMTGKLKISGSTGVAMKLAAMLGD